MPNTLRTNPDETATTPRWILDAGHGWVAVSIHAYPDALDCGTGFGYLDARAGVAYLEEDCEAAEFIARHPELDPGAWTVIDYSTSPSGDAPCRALPSLPSRMVTA